jgi:hypothetical protein
MVSKVELVYSERHKYNSLGILIAWAWCVDYFGPPACKIWDFDGTYFYFAERSAAVLFAITFSIKSHETVDIQLRG